MNKIKYLDPKGHLVVLKVSQLRRAFEGVEKKDGKGFHLPQSMSKAGADKLAVKQGLVRCSAKGAA